MPCRGRTAGSGCAGPALTVTGTTEENAGLGSAVLTSVQQVGGAIGVAVLVALATREGFSLALTVAAALVAIGAILIATMLRPRLD
jgi:predicted MFS family arabinose efflux permease